LTGLTAAINGIPFAEINGTKIISNVDSHCYTITTSTAATSTGLCWWKLIESVKEHCITT